MRSQTRITFSILFLYSKEERILQFFDRLTVHDFGHPLPRTGNKPFFDSGLMRSPT